MDRNKVEVWIPRQEGRAKRLDNIQETLTSSPHDD